MTRMYPWHYIKFRDVPLLIGASKKSVCRWIEVPQTINLPDPEGPLGYWALAA